MEMTVMKFGQMSRPAANGARIWGALAVTAMLVQGCDQPQSRASATRLYAVDMTGGAKTCSAPRVEPKNGAPNNVSMKMANDGGWCGVLASQSGRPYTAGLVTVRPKSGKVYVHTVGDDTRIDYTPDRGFAGGDRFTVKLVPGDALVQVDVSVTK